MQQAFTLVARVLLNPGDEVYVEDPGLPQMAAAFRAVGAHVRSVPVDDQGLALPEAEADGTPRMVGVTPSHQFPLGITMSLSRRVELLEWAHRTDVWILEDDDNSAFRYSGEPVPALQGLDSAGRVLYAGSFSKLMFPSLRLGYLVVPPDLVEPFTRMRSISDRGSSRVNQMALADFITEGHFRQHIRRMRTLYANRQAVLSDTLDREIGDLIEVVPGDAGLHLIGWVPPEADDRAVSDHLARHDVAAPPLSLYSTRALDRGGLLLGYGGFPREAIRTGVRKMADALASFSW
jgi:GntR family transcriptional regulator/MocR family aminotransferase